MPKQKETNASTSKLDETSIVTAQWFETENAKAASNGSVNLVFNVHMTVASLILQRYSATLSILFGSQ